ncbi:HAD family hydrolase [Flavicella marina]|uniref:HAD family hydrolase n=1 Tax=Flavicella marina TaxID=1475951 RepID=UPI001264642B|nr:HAD family hydrolase [Flavicella marina]
MDFSKVKLVVTDMDGTLLNSKHEVSDRFFEIHKSLKEKNIHFAAASGRQYHSIISKLLPLKKDITIISENGAFAKQNETELFSFDLPKEKLINCLKYVKDIEGIGIILCGKKYAYIENSNPEFVATITQFYSSYKIVENFTEVKNDTFFKAAIFHPECSEKYILPKVAHLSDDMQVLVSGKNWLDISNQDANKGIALSKLQEKLGITPDETLAFGDYNNDLKMLEKATFSYAMKNAHPNVKEIANYETLSNEERGVDFILEKLIK